MLIVLYKIKPSINKEKKMSLPNSKVLKLFKIFIKTQNKISKAGKKNKRNTTEIN